MTSVTLKYNGGTTTKAYSVLGVRGLDDVDDLEFWPKIQHERLDGSMSENVKAFRRIITIDFGVILVKADRVWLVSFLIAPDKIVTCASPAEDVPVVLGNVDGMANEWIEGLEFARAFTLSFKETAVLGAAPAAWA
jgi:hypothetical protein